MEKEKAKPVAKKRPSVETEGRLTIACHMKKDNDLNLSAALLYSFCTFASAGAKLLGKSLKTKSFKIIK